MYRRRYALLLLLPLSFLSTGCWFLDHCTGSVGYSDGKGTGTVQCGGSSPAGAPNMQAIAEVAQMAAGTASSAWHPQQTPPKQQGPAPFSTPQPIILYRLTDILIRDPHTFQDVGSGVCIDRTGIVNNEIHSRFNSDTDADGQIDAGAVLAFQGTLGTGPGGVFQIISAACDTLPSGHCLPDRSTALIDASYTYSNNNANPCFAPPVGTLHPYVPSLALPSTPCFVTAPFELQVSFGGSTFVLNSTMLAGSFAGASADSIVNGVMRGFISEAAAATILLPSGTPDINGQYLSATFPGGTGSCAAGDDRDVGPDGVTHGWWIYANFRARRVEFPSNVLDAGPRFSSVGPSLEALPNPFRPSVRILYTLPAEQAAQLAVLDPAGRRIRTLAGGVQDSGRHEVTWDGSTDDGHRAPTGIYYAILSTAGGNSVTRLVRLN